MAEQETEREIEELTVHITDGVGATDPQDKPTPKAPEKDQGYTKKTWVTDG